MNIRRLASLAVVMAIGLATQLSAQLSWSVFDEATLTPVNNTSDNFSITVPAGKRYTLVATNFVPLSWNASTKVENFYLTLNFKASGGVTSLSSGTRAFGFGLYNNNGTADNFADDKGYFTWLNGRNSGGSLIELRRRNGDGTSPSLLNPTGTAWNSLGTGAKTLTAGALSDSNSYSIQMHLMARAPGVSFGSSSSTSTAAGIWVSGDGISQTAYTNPDNPPGTYEFNQVGFMFYNSSAADVTLTINSVVGITAVNPPSVKTQPASLTLNAGQSNSLAVVANGTAPLSYQWKKDGVDIAGATGASLALANVSATDAGSYTVAIANAYGSVTSAAAAVTISAGAISPTITAQPASVTVNAGSPASFSVANYGSDPLTYQWKKDGADISGATTSTYSIGAAAVADAGSYTVVLTNAANSLTSSAAALTVNTLPAISSQPASVTATAGQNVTFKVVATGSPSPSYQWLKNGSNISGATSDTLTINDVKLSDCGNYKCSIINSVGAVTSDSAVLAIPSTMAATSFAPAPAATGVTTDSVLKVSFDQAPVAGISGRIRIYEAGSDTLVDTIDMGVTPYTRTIGTASSAYNFYPVIVSGNTATIFPHAGVLGYGKTYYVTMEQSVIRDSSGASFIGVSDKTAWTFSTKAAGPSAGATSITVAADGSGDFSTVQGAIDFVPVNNTQRVTITVKRGTYTEMNYIGSTKPFITIQGEDRAQTVLQYADNNNFNSGNNRAMFGCDANDFILQTITLRNLTPAGGSQAEAIRFGGLRAALNRVNLYSYQDTFMANGSNNPTVFVTDSYIEGDVDFMWGQASVYFQRCEIKAIRAGFYVQARNTQTTKGFVFVDCRLTGVSGLTGYFLARADPNSGQFPYSQVVYLNCAMGSHIAAAGWKLDNASSSSTVQFWEYMSTDLNGTLLDVSGRLSSSKQMDAATATQYRDPAFVLNGWSPSFAPTVDVPSSTVSANVGDTVSLSVQANGAPQPSVQWYKNGSAIDGATGATLSFVNASASVSGSYSVIATNSLGSATGTPIIVTVSHSKYYGSYFGTLGAAGSFALYLRDDGTGVFLGKEASGGVLIGRSVKVDASGKVSAVVGSTTGSSFALSATIAVSGSISGSMTGGSTIALSGARAAVSGSTQDYAGYFQVGATGSSSTVSMILGAGGQAYVVTQVGSNFDAGSGSVSASGLVNASTASSQSVTGLINGSASSSIGILTTGTGAQIALSGSSDATAAAQRFQAFSVRGRVSAGDNVVILGFVITGAENTNVLVRAIGPTLAAISSTQYDALTAPKLDIVKDGVVVASNTNWTTASNKDEIVTASAAVGASPLSVTLADSALKLSLAPGAYSAVVSSADGKAGLAVVEIIDLTMGNRQRLADLAVRSPSGPGHNTLIAGLVVSGGAPKRMLIRGIGPSLASWGVAGCLTKPVLSIYKGTQLVTSNSGIAGSADATAIALATQEGGAGALISAGTDSAVVVNLAPGVYTAQLVNSDGATGVGMIEIYELP